MDRYVLALALMVGWSCWTLAADPKSTELKRQIATLEASDPQAAALPKMYAQLAAGYTKTIDIAEADAASRQALQRAEAAAKRKPDDAPTRAQYADILLARMMLQRRMCLWKDAQQTIQTGLALAKQYGDSEEGRLLEACVRFQEFHRLAQQLKIDEAIDYGETLVAFLEQVQQKYPQSVAVRTLVAEQLQVMGRVRIQAGRAGEAIPLLTKAATLAKELHEAHPKDDVYTTLHCRTMNDSALAYRDAGFFLVAEQRYLTAVNLAKQRLTTDPESVSKKRMLVAIYHNLGGLVGPSINEEDRLQYREMGDKIRQTMPAVVVDDDQDIAESMVRAASSIFGHSGEAIADTQAYSDAMAKLIELHPNIPIFSVQYAHATSLLLAKESRTGITDAVYDLLAKTRKVLTKLIESDGTVPLYEFLLHSLETEEMYLVLQKGTQDEARQAFAQRRARAVRFFAKYPKNTLFPHLYSEIMIIPHDIVVERQDYPLSMEIGRFILDQRQALIKQHPREPHYRRASAIMWGHLAVVYRLAHSNDGVDVCLQQSIKEWEAIAKDHDDQPDMTLQLVDAHRRLAQWHNDRERFKESLASYETALKLARERLKANADQTCFADRLAALGWFASRTALNDNQIDKSITLLSQAIQAREYVIAKHPKRRGNYDILRVMYKERALLHNRMGKTELYDADWKRADAVDAQLAQLDAGSSPSK